MRNARVCAAVWKTCRRFLKLDSFILRNHGGGAVGTERANLRRLFCRSAWNKFVGTCRRAPYPHGTASRRTIWLNLAAAVLELAFAVEQVTFRTLRAWNRRTCLSLLQRRRGGRLETVGGVRNRCQERVSRFLHRAVPPPEHGLHTARY